MVDKGTPMPFGQKTFDTTVVWSTESTKCLSAKCFSAKGRGTVFFRPGSAPSIFFFIRLDFFWRPDFCCNNIRPKNLTFNKCWPFFWCLLATFVRTNALIYVVCRTFVLTKKRPYFCFNQSWCGVLLKLMFLAWLQTNTCFLYYFCSNNRCLYNLCSNKCL